AGAAQTGDDEQSGNGAGDGGAGAVRPAEVESEEHLRQAGADEGADDPAAPAEDDQGQRGAGGHEGQPVVRRARPGDDRGRRGQQPRLAPGPGRRRRHSRRQRRPEDGVDGVDRRRGTIGGGGPGGGGQAQGGDRDRSPGQHQPSAAGDEDAGGGEGGGGDQDTHEEVHGL